MWGAIWFGVVLPAPNPVVLRRGFSLADRNRGGRLDELLEQRGIVPLAVLEVRKGDEEVFARQKSLQGERTVGGRARRPDAARSRRPMPAVGREGQDVVLGGGAATGILEAPRQCGGGVGEGDRPLHWLACEHPERCLQRFAPVDGRRFDRPLVARAGHAPGMCEPVGVRLHARKRETSLCIHFSMTAEGRELATG